MRGNSLTWGFSDDERLRDQYDLVIATSMVDVSALKGFRPNLATCPWLVYFHENQFDYPDSQHQKGLLEIQLTSIYTALATDKIAFNSPYNQTTFLRGAQALLNQMPDGVPTHVLDAIKEKSAVLPVPLEDTLWKPLSTELNTAEKSEGENRLAKNSDAVTVVWNHRWEYDKSPDRLLNFVNALAKCSDRPAVRFHIIGQQFRKVPPVFDTLHQRLGELGWLGRWGFIEDVHEYRSLLAHSDAVLSTALHDFQGLSVLEACALGCSPLLPDRLAYPYFVGAEHLYPSFIETPQREAEEAVSVFLNRCLSGFRKKSESSERMKAWSWAELGQQYQCVIESLVKG
ncbi:hypothetical protein GCM10007877_23260 [Marinibactrum halimedae]|uniref:tRNA-queuosine alpha-mannosyltransferase n=2 Tax=Marinibactrum halimedae TaxID=1444977 RepID=A0AA37T4F0_9GAMM|nr:hypothetical protein GCM10007877_23260 [Marinibactrum halimedae]